MTDTVRVNLAERGYDIHVTTNSLHEIGPFAKSLGKGRFACVIADENVATHAEQVSESLQAAGFRTATCPRPSGESQKSLSVASELYDRLIEEKADRKTLVVAVGGGVIGDLGGFVAATYARGVPLLMVPTTLLSMVDSSVGGKVGVNHSKAKNMIGAFHQPVGVWIDTSTLDTLPDREFRSGVAEVVKYGVIMDVPFFEYLECNVEAILRRDPEVIRHVVKRCCRLKADVVENDEREETGLRAILNYGHTFAHAFEKAAQFGEWLHGEAVSAGMECASHLAHHRGQISPDVVTRQTRLLSDFGLPLKSDLWPAQELIATMRNDKKAVAGQLRFILPKRLGEVALFDDVREEDVVEVLKQMGAA
ncbi:MAG: 3-dehydroquinate synthase [Gemmataceae bacterium]